MMNLVHKIRKINMATRIREYLNGDEKKLAGLREKKFTCNEEVRGSNKKAKKCP